MKITTYGDLINRLLNGSGEYDDDYCQLWLPVGSREAIFIQESKGILSLVNNEGLKAKAMVTKIEERSLGTVTNDDALAAGCELDVWDQAIAMRNYLYDPEVKDSPRWFQMWTDKMEGYVEMKDIIATSFRTLWQSVNGAEDRHDERQAIVVTITKS